MQQGLAAAVSLHLQGRGEEALELLRQLVEANDDSNEARYGCARLSEELGRYEEAVEHYAKYLDRNPDSLNGLFHVGVCLQRLGRWSDSVEPFRIVIAAEPGNAAALASLGLSLLREQDPGQALEMFEAAVRLEPDNEMALMGRAACHHTLLEYEDAERSYREVLERRPGHEGALVNLILLARQRNSPAEAASIAGLLLQMETARETAHEALAWAAVEEQRFEEADRHCEACCELDPERFENWVNLGVCRQKAGNTAGAIEAYERAAALRPAAPAPQVQLGYLHHMLGQFERAAAHYETALGSAPETLEAVLNLAIIHDQQNRPGDAERLYERAASLDPANRTAWLALGRLRAERFDFTGAVTAFEACKALDPGDPEAQMHLALSLHRAGKTADARNVLTRALEAEPGFTDAIRLLATIELEQGRAEEALRWHLALIAAGEASPEVYHNAGLLADELHLPDQALEYLRQSVELDPQFGEALVTLGHVLEDLGKRDEARDCWRRAVEAKPALAEGYFLGGKES